MSHTPEQIKRAAERCIEQKTCDPCEMYKSPCQEIFAARILELETEIAKGETPKPETSKMCVETCVFCGQIIPPKNKN